VLSIESVIVLYNEDIYNKVHAAGHRGLIPSERFYNKRIKKASMRKRIFYLVFALSFVLLSLFPVAESALSLDQTPVIDDANIFGNRTGEVETAATKLLSKGADVRVRTILTYGSSANLDQYEAQLEQQSPSWLGQNGDRKNNLIVLIISTQERQTGLYYGSVWDSILANNWLRIQTDIMNPLFRNGDYVTGTIRGLAEIQRLIETNGQTSAPVQTPKGASNWWIVPLVILVIVALLVGLLVFYNFRKSRARQLAIRQKAILAKQAAASGINQLIETTQMLEIKVNVISGQVVPDESTVLSEGLEKAKRLTDQSSQAYSELSHSAGDPENPRLGEAQLGVIEPEYQKILSNLREANDAVKSVEDNLVVIQKAVGDFPNKVDEVNTAIVDSLSKQAELNKAGFKTSFAAELTAKGQDFLEKAKSLAAERRVIEGLKCLDAASDQIKQANQAVADLPRKKQEVESAIPLLASRIEKTKESIINGRTVFERLSQGFAETTWESVLGNGTEAENRVNWALDAQRDTGNEIEQQDWQQALDLVKKGNDWLNEADSLMKAISELEVNLLAARRDAPAEISTAQTDIASAWDYINRYDDDIRESLEDDLRAAESKNNLAKEELNRPQPDYFKVCKAAREAHESADKILLQARGEHEMAERLRAKAASSLRDAGAKVSIAARYIENHHPVVQQEARSYYTNAVESLRQAQAAPDSNSQIALAAQAESAADQAYSMASRDVNNTTMNIPNFGRPGAGIPNMGIPTIIIPPVGHTSGRSPSWGSNRPSIPSSGNSVPRGGGGSSGWSARGGGFGGGGSGKGGGSTGW
jgi:uncharacterized membrane protein YgcG